MLLMMRKSVRDEKDMARYLAREENFTYHVNMRIPNLNVKIKDFSLIQK